MKKRLFNFLLLLIIMCFPYSSLAYTDNDEPVTTSKVYNFIVDDVNSDDIIKLYNPNNTTIPNYFNLNNYFYEKYGFHIPVANQKNLGLCDTFSTIKSIETNYALKTGNFIDISERYVDYLTTSDFYGKRTAGHICENNVCDQGSGSNINQVLAIVQMFGAPLEKEIPYINYDENDYDLFTNSHNVLKVNSVISFPHLTGADNLEDWIKILKIHIMKYGSLRVAVCAPKKTIYNSRTAAAYLDDFLNCPNEAHGVSIVGWDDNYPKENFNTVPEHNGAFIVLNSWGTTWGDNGYYYVSYDDSNILEQMYGVLDTVEAKKYNIYSNSAKMFGIGGYGASVIKNYTGMKFDRVKENEYISHIAIGASNAKAENVSTKVRFYLNTIDDTFDKEKLIFLGEELSSSSQSEVTIINLDEPIKITGDRFSLVYEVTGDKSNFTFHKAVDKDNNGLSGLTYSSNGFNQTWSLTSQPIFPVFVYTIDGIVKDATIETNPVKSTYIKGQSIDLTGGVINVTYNDNTSAQVNMTDPAVKLYDYDTDNLGNNIVTILYEGKLLTFSITVKNDIEEISVKTNPNKTIFIKGENIDLTGGIILVRYEDNSTKTVLMNSQTVSINGYDNNSLGQQELTVSYGGKTTTFSVLVVESSYTVTFNSDGGSSVPSQTINYNEKVTRPSNPTKTGYTFVEWRLNGSTYDFNTPVTSNITLTAVWQINKYTVLFNSDGGSSVVSQTVNYNAKATKPSNPTKTGYTFVEWRLNGSTYDFNTPVTSNITLTAVWQINKYTVLFNSDGGSSVPSQTVNYNEKVIKPSDPTKTGYTFVEWRQNGSTYDFNTPVTSNMTLTAIWKKNETVEDETLKEILQDHSYTVASNLVTGLKVGMTITELKNKLGNSSIQINTSNTLIATGVVIKKGNESYTIVIKGDLTGDGKINSGDLLQMRKYLLEEVNLTGAYKEAGIIESIGNIKSLDLLRLRQYLLGEYIFK